MPYGRKETLENTIRIGCIGFGAMGKTHLYAVRNLPFFFSGSPVRAEVVGVCTAHLETAQRAAKEYGIPFATANEEELIARPDIDAIDICTPNVFHYETAKKALLAGKHVYCEKPLAVTPEEANELADLAEKSSKAAQIVFNNRFLLPVMRAKEIMDRGGIGRVLAFRGLYLHASLTDPNKPGGWKLDREICGGGVLFDLGSHIIDLLAYLCGPFASVSGCRSIAYPDRAGGENTEADEAFTMVCRLSSGAVGTVEVSKVIAGANDDFSFEINGETGSLRFSLMEPNWLYYYDKSMGKNAGYTKIECVNNYGAPGGEFPGAKAPVGWLRGHVGSMHAFLEAVAGLREAHPSFREGAHVQAVMDAAYRSDKTRTWVDVV